MQGQPILRTATEADRAEVLALLRSEGLEADFKPAEFVVAHVGDGGLLACGRLKRLGEGTLELASIAVRPERRGTGLGQEVTRRLLQDVAGPVYALALAPGFFARFGFVPIGSEALPATLRAKAEGMCASTGFVAMRLG